jgi:hypothetical protein
MEQTSTIKLERLGNAWCEPDGTLHPVDEWGHEKWAYEHHECEPYDLKKAGWIKLSEGDWCCVDVTQQQLDVIYDWHVANREKWKPEQFKVK